MSARRPVRRLRRRRRGVAAVSVLVVLGVTAGGLWWHQQGGTSPARERCAATVDGVGRYLSPQQAENAALIAGATLRRGLPARAATIGLATALQESKLINIAYGDRDSLGLFQQRPSQGWGTAEQVQDPLYATDAFYDALVAVPGYLDLDVTVAAQAVQRSAFPDAYAQHESSARAWASALTGNTPAAVSCELGPVVAPRPAGDVAAAFTARAARDLGVTGVTVAPPDPDRPGALAVTVDPGGLAGGQRERAGWAVAQWAVASAWASDADEIEVGDRVWTRAGAVRAARAGTGAWQAAAGDPLEPGTVRVLLTVAD